MQIGKTKNNTYYYRVFYNDPKTGQEKRKYSSGFKGKKEATRACSEFLSSLENNDNDVTMSSRRILFSEVVDDYLTHISVYVQDTSLRNNKRIIDKYIYPRFKQVCIDEITKIDMRQWMDTIQTTKKSIKYKNDILRMMKVIFNLAQEYFDVEQDPTIILKTIRKDKSIITESNIWEI